ncbi:hypothetical protein C8Q79DRAFT_495198 [Trametes meyenii]|nr:hypothetical protein C8Q79DRAFT_495198 [Trametes meyenii]
MNIPSPPEGPFSLAAMSFIVLSVSVSCLPVPASITELAVLCLCSTVTPYEYALGISALSAFATLVALGSVISHTPSARRDGAPVCLGHGILSILANVCRFTVESLLMLFCEGVVLGVEMFIFVVHERLMPVLWRGLKLVVLRGVPALFVHVWGLYIVFEATLEFLRRRACAVNDTVLPRIRSTLSSACKATASWASRVVTGISAKYDDAALWISATCSVLLDAYSLLLEQDGKFKLAHLPFRDGPTAMTASRISSTFATPRATKTNTDITKTEPSTQIVEDMTESIPTKEELVSSAEDGTSNIEETLSSVVDGISSVETPIPDPMPVIMYTTPTTPPPAPAPTTTTLSVFVALIYVPEPIILEDADITKAVLSIEDGDTTLLVYVTAVTPKPEPEWEYATCDEVVDESGALTPIVSPTPPYTAPYNTAAVTAASIATVDTEPGIVRFADVPITVDVDDDLEEAILPFQHEATLPFEDEDIFPFDGEDALPFDHSTPISVAVIFPFQNEDILPYYDEVAFPFANEETLPFEESISPLKPSTQMHTIQTMFPFQDEDELPFDVEAMFPFKGEAALPFEVPSFAHSTEAALSFEGEDTLPFDFEAALPFEGEEALPFEESIPSLQYACLLEIGIDTEFLDHDPQVPSEALTVTLTSVCGTTIETLPTCDTEDQSIETDEMEAAPVLLTNVAPTLYELPRIPISVSFDSHLGRQALKPSAAVHASVSFKPLLIDRTYDAPPTKDDGAVTTTGSAVATTPEPELNTERVFVPRAQAPSFTPRAHVPPPTKLSPEARPFQSPQAKQAPPVCPSTQTTAPPTASIPPIPPQPSTSTPPMLLPARHSLQNPPPFWAPRPVFLPNAQAPTFVPRATVPVFAPEAQAPVQPSFQPRVQAPAFVPRALPLPPPPVFAPRPDAPSFVPRAQIPAFIPRPQVPAFIPGAVVDKVASEEPTPAEHPVTTGETDGDAVEGDGENAGDKNRTKRKKTRRGGKRVQKQRQRKQAKIRAKAEAKAKAQAEAGDVVTVQDTVGVADAQAAPKWSWADEMEAAEDGSEDEDMDSEVEIILEPAKVEIVEMSGLLA